MGAGSGPSTCGARHAWRACTLGHSRCEHIVVLLVTSLVGSVLMAWSVAGCGGDSAALGPPLASPPDSDRVRDDDTNDSDAFLAASCVIQPDNRLRHDCHFELATAAALSIEVMRVDGFVQRRFESAIAKVHDVTLWGLSPSTVFDWKASTVGAVVVGQIATLELPAGLAAFATSTSGPKSSVDHVLIPQRCGDDWYVLIVDGEGTVKWYENLGEGKGSGPLSGLTGFAWTREDTLVAQFDAERVVEIRANGSYALDRGDFDLPLHHDIRAVGDFLYVLNADEENGDVVDGFYVIERATGVTVDRWALRDHVSVTGGGGGDFWNKVFPGSADWSHGNSLHVYPDGTALLSLRRQDAVIEVIADHTDPSFGSVNWILQGTSGNAMQSTVALADSDVGFDGQHCVSWSRSGQLMLFDNGTGNSRAVLMDVDPVAGIAATAEAWDVGTHCQIQGSLYEQRPGLGYLATCTTANLVQAFVRGRAEPTWTMRATCGIVPLPPPLARAVPLVLE